MPDGDAKIDNVNYQSFNVSDCPNCGGILAGYSILVNLSPKLSKEHSNFNASPGILVIDPLWRHTLI